MNNYRLIVCFDVKADNLVEAYDTIRGIVEASPGIKDENIGWETSDEWYDDDGEPGDPSELSQAIIQSMTNRGVLNREYDADSSVSTQCDECGESIPDDEPSMVNACHDESCSLHP